MSLYNLATASNRPEQILIINRMPPTAADDDAGTPPPSGQPVSVTTQGGNQQTAPALAKIARFIPTETITIYLGGISASAAMTGENTAPGKVLAVLLDKITVYWVTALVITPAIFLLIRATDRAKMNKSVWTEFPYWKISAAVIAFLIWGLAVPGSPYAEHPVAKVAVAFGAILVSIILDLIDQYFDARQSSPIV